jgi:hypothetical protein
MSEDRNKKKREQANVFLDGINQELKSMFEQLRPLSLNSNTKGGEYEQHIADIFHRYLGSRFDFHVRAHLLDVEMTYLDLFSIGENEIDIIATFSNAVPKIIFKAGTRNYISYDSVAFTLDVKARLDNDKLEKDLEKTLKISKLSRLTHKIGDIIHGGSYLLDRPLRFLFYHESHISEGELDRLLKKYYSIWDVIYIINNNQIILNRSLPAVDALMKERSFEGPILSWGGNKAFVLLLLIISTTIPQYHSVDITHTFLKLDEFANKTA